MKKPFLKKDVRLVVRVDRNFKTFLENSAEVYAGGDVATWVRYCCMNYQIPKEILKKGPLRGKGPKGGSMRKPKRKPTDEHVG